MVGQPVSTVRDDGWNLDLRNPNRALDLSERPPMELLQDAISVEQAILALLHDIEKTLDS
jgi:hypothetical protein